MDSGETLHVLADDPATATRFYIIGWPTVGYHPRLGYHHRSAALHGQKFSCQFVLIRGSKLLPCNNDELCIMNYALKMPNLSYRIHFIRGRPAFQFDGVFLTKLVTGTLHNGISRITWNTLSDKSRISFMNS